jgi:hypothetical protein
MDSFHLQGEGINYFLMINLSENAGRKFRGNPKIASFNAVILLKTGPPAS